MPRDPISSPHLDRPLPLLPSSPRPLAVYLTRESFFRAWKNYLRGRHNTLWNDGSRKRKKNGWILVANDRTIKQSGVLDEEPVRLYQNGFLMERQLSK